MLCYKAKDVQLPGCPHSTARVDINSVVVLRDCDSTCVYRTAVAPHSPAQHEFGVLAMDVVPHQLQQQGPHDVGVVFQLPVQSHRQQGGKIHLGPGVEFMTALQGTDELQTHHNTHTRRQNKHNIILSNTRPRCY